MSSQEIKPFDKNSSDYLRHLDAVAAADVAGLREAEKSYGNSWKQRGGVGAFMMLCRKWDRLERRVAQQLDGAKYDIFEHVLFDTRSEGVIDDIRDLRRYLMLVEAELLSRGTLLGRHRDNPEVRRAAVPAESTECRASWHQEFHDVGDRCPVCKKEAR